MRAPYQPGMEGKDVKLAQLGTGELNYTVEVSNDHARVLATAAEKPGE